MPYFSLKERRSSSSSCSSDDSYEQLEQQQAFWRSQRDPVSRSTTSPWSPGPSPSLFPDESPTSPSATKVLDSVSKACVEDFVPASSSSFGNESPPQVLPAEEPVRQVQPPDWHSLLFGGKEKNCDENPSIPEIDTYFEDCKLAEDVALNLLNKYHLPVANGFREINTSKVTSALRSLQKSKKIEEQFDDSNKVLAYVLMLDYLACSCQEGNLLSLYQNCKDDKKQYHLDLINCDLGSTLRFMQPGCCSLEQLNSAEKLVKASFEMIPKRFNATYIKNSIMRKISILKSKEACKTKQGMPNKSQDEPRVKKIKTTVATSKNWGDSSSESSPSTSLKLKPKIMHSTPSKFDGTRDWTFTSTSELTRQTVTSKSVSSPHFLDTLFASDDASSLVGSQQSKLVRHQTLASRKNSTSTTITNIPGYGISDLSDDDLPDIPINIPKTSSKASVLNPKLHPQKITNGSSEQAEANVNASKSISSPYKSNSNTWKVSKYDSSTKFLPTRSPMKRVVEKYSSRKQQLGRSPLKLAKQQQKNSSPRDIYDSYRARDKSSGPILKAMEQKEQKKKRKSIKVCKCLSCQMGY